MQVNEAMVRGYEYKKTQLTKDFKVLTPIQFLALMIYQDKMNYYNSVISNLKEGR